MTMQGPRARVLLAAAAVAVTGLGGLAGAAPAVAAPTPRAAVSDPAQYVNTFTGTRPGDTDFGNGGGAGNTFPGVTAPLGMLQLSPDTATYQHGGYFYDDNRIRDFSLTHISGAGCGDYGNVPFLPVTGTAPVDYATFSHANESASPGSYAVTFDNGIRTELASTSRTGIARITYPAGQTGSFVLDAGRAFNAASGSVTIGTDTLTGYTDSGGFCGAGNRYRIYFTVHFDRAFSGSGILSTTDALDRRVRTATGHSAGAVPATRSRSGARPTAAPRVDASAAGDSGARALVSFDTSASRAVTARFGISFVSLAGAEGNLSAEQGGRGFDDIRDTGRADWNGLLGRISVGGGSDAATRRFYTALYHSFLHPSVLSDTDGQYPGFDGKVHLARSGHAQYADFSGWDVYRSQVQLVALLLPAQAADIAQSAVNQAAQAGYWDRWTLANGNTGVMVGDPLPIIASSIHAFGGTDFDAAAAVSLAVSGSRDDRERPGHAPYDEHGFLPADTFGGWGSVSSTLEYTSADFAVSQLAQRIGDTSTYRTFLRRSANWRTLFNSGSRYLQPRNADFSWPAFSPTQQDQYVEGDAAQYRWMVPYNYRGLFDALGGDAAARSEMDSFFTKLNGGPGSPNAYLGNEPSANTPWMYDYAGAPSKTQDVVRRALTTLFSATPGGEVGNDDLGQMSSWAVWASIGAYPEVPGRADLVLASPAFPDITISRANGPTITITAPGASDTTRYVQSLRVNGTASDRPWLGADFVGAGGSLDFTLGADPSGWGSAPADAPPSYDVGPATPVTGQVTGIAGKCLDVDHSSAVDGTKVQTYTCNSSDAQMWTVERDGTLRALGKCLDVSNSGITNGSLAQLWTCNGTGAQQWEPRSGGALVSPEAGRCLDVPNSSTADGVQVQLYDCNQSAAQQWTLPSGAAAAAAGTGRRPAVPSGGAATGRATAPAVPSPGSRKG